MVIEPGFAPWGTESGLQAFRAYLFEKVRDGPQRQSGGRDRGSDGIRRHICLKLGQALCRLAILGRSPDRLSAVRDAVQPEALACSCDPQQSGEFTETAQQSRVTFDAVDVFINNAGVRLRARPAGCDLGGDGGSDLADEPHWYDPADPCASARFAGAG
ncbi:hypothetical protein So717_02520 [Roseobacter cerasinus]|uniref:Uncharacterized protein n=1 Tax=Roseobacter cerasinus TaxID=2602289 RepID=A0A640VK91_9RHOB|nr:hypothetical protein So717_02520 [Roseobacter cerasinus]